MCRDLAGLQPHLPKVVGALGVSRGTSIQFYALDSWTVQDLGKPIVKHGSHSEARGEFSANIRTTTSRTPWGALIQSAPTVGRGGKPLRGHGRHAPKRRSSLALEMNAADSVGFLEGCPT